MTSPPGGPSSGSASQILLRWVLQHGVPHLRQRLRLLLTYAHNMIAAHHLPAALGAARKVAASLARRLLAIVVAMATQLPNGKAILNWLVLKALSLQPAAAPAATLGTSAAVSAEKRRTLVVRLPFSMR